MPNKVTIVNKALRMIGQSELSSLSEGSAAAARCERALPAVLDEVLRVHPWSHATVWATLPRLTVNPPFGFQYAYGLPSDCIRIVDVRSDGDLRRQGLPFEVVGTSIYTDAKPCYVRYVVRDESSIDFWPPDFCEAVSCKLAADISIPLARDGGKLMSAMLERYHMALDIARHNDTAARFAPELDEVATNAFIAARQ